MNVNPMEGAKEGKLLEGSVWLGETPTVMMAMEPARSSVDHVPQM